MGGAPSFKPFQNLTFPFFPIFTLLILITARANNDSTEPNDENIDDNGVTSSPPLPRNDIGAPRFKAFRPGTAVIVAVLTATFGLTLLVLLYVKNCNDRNTVVTVNEGASHVRKNSGIERGVVESLPIFRFGSLRGQKDGLDCAVCLTRFGDTEVLRLLPKCNHAFHVECVDTWFEAHSTCPLCRYRLDPEDVVLANDEARAKTTRCAEEELEQALDVESEVGGSQNDDASLEIVCVAEKEDAKTTSSDGSSDRRKDGARRVEHRIVVDGDERWSDNEACDVLHLTSDMITWSTRERRGKTVSDENLRRVSEMTGVRRERGEQEQPRERMVKRWLSWASRSRRRSDVH
ncbi:hypothetical protein RJT34_11967 [Clitoria ternatea]|uniref:RING-type E3 ubiquitin transferase n=1 Tax=Clitoria ternatea TaxID=43366 RepID=A0AAN9JL02_CLITE